jgi:phosphoglycerate dehydrogenase-like enzyme
MKIKVTSKSFSKHPDLRQTLLDTFPGAEFNDEGRKFDTASMIDFIGDADGLVLGLEPADDTALAACPNLKIVSKFGVGLDSLDVAACERRGIAVGWTGGTNKRSVAEMDLCFMLALARNLYPASLELKSGTWNKNGGFQLSEKTVGVIGLGYTGSEIIRLLKPFDCTVLGNDIVDKSEFCKEADVREASKDEIFETADFVTVHTPLTDKTHHLINRDTLAQMKPMAFVINTARGPIVDGDALKQALIEGIIAGAALDVYEDEPPTDMELLGLPNLFCTPHIGGNADEAVVAMGMSAIHHLKEFFQR